MIGRLRGQRGEIAPALMLVMFALVAAGTWFLDHARAATLTAEGDTAVDAAALAGADALRAGGGPGVGAIAALLATGHVPPGVEAAATAAARDYARRNGGELLDGQLEKVPGQPAVRYTATVRTADALDGRYPTRTAAAELRFTLREPGAGACVSQPEVDTLVVAAGVADRHNGVSGLAQCQGTDTENLDPEFKLAFLRAEAALKEVEGDAGVYILLSSAYRSAARQAELYAAYLACQATGSSGCIPAAPPGSSLHNFGRAIDVPGAFSPRLQRAIEAVPGTGMCFPDIANDEYHFQDCRGRAGLGPLNGQAFGLLEFEPVRLIRTGE